MKCLLIASETDKAGQCDTSAIIITVWGNHVVLYSSMGLGMQTNGGVYAAYGTTDYSHYMNIKGIPRVSQCASGVASTTFVPGRGTDVPLSRRQNSLSGNIVDNVRNPQNVT